MKAILITGSSSGYGLETARYFLDRSWRVIATMRTQDESVLPHSESLEILPLDVTDEKSISAVIEAAGPIDVLVNNAGIGAVGAFEAMPMSLVRNLFETNTLGVMALTQAVIPQMRKRQSGVIVNVTSSVTIAPFPLAAAYTASKQAIEGFSGSLAHELNHFNVRVKLVEPGYAPTTSFAKNTQIPIEELIPADYADFAAPIFEKYSRPTMTTKEIDVAESIWSAVYDKSGKLRFPAGADAAALATDR